MAAARKEGRGRSRRRRKAACDALPSAPCGYTLLGSLGMLVQRRDTHAWLNLSHGAQLLVHPIANDKRIDDVAAGNAPQPPHPHRQETLSNIDQIVGNHEPLASRAFHESPPVNRWQPTSPNPAMPVLQPSDTQSGCQLISVRPCAFSRRIVECPPENPSK